ncbi:hypothetical protein [Stigmatella erecta]|uniref:Histidine phosphatase superfamily (Branch 1) n=1 Tax=Stigmatella erecta TaxID=83460 RepID=A0A1I0KUW5_9BACT|nr:hypothetical protein [Stigmatella erecta]SEU29531.1 hypothetical protein SAMN05443639_114123 [Stigmatella erecta]
MQGTSPAQPQSIMIIRHAEKPAGTIQGNNLYGAIDKHSLTPMGWQRAGALCVLFAAQGAPVRQGVVTPTAIFASGVEHDSTKSLRPEETVVPVAALLNGVAESSFLPGPPPSSLVVPLNGGYTLGNERDLVKAVLALTGNVLIAWQHQNIPAITQQIIQQAQVSNPDDIPSQWPDGRFDMVFVFTRSSAGYTFAQVPQLLLPGDSSKPFPA